MIFEENKLYEINTTNERNVISGISDENIHLRRNHIDLQNFYLNTLWSIYRIHGEELLNCKNIFHLTKVRCFEKITKSVLKEIMNSKEKTTLDNLYSYKIKLLGFINTSRLKSKY
jgi:hypothetical protein